MCESASLQPRNTGVSRNPPFSLHALAAQYPDRPAIYATILRFASQYAKYMTVAGGMRICVPM